MRSVKRSKSPCDPSISATAGYGSEARTPPLPHSARQRRSRRSAWSWEASKSLARGALLDFDDAHHAAVFVEQHMAVEQERTARHIAKVEQNLRQAGFDERIIRVRFIRKKF